jgi:hypothetical protein
MPYWSILTHSEEYRLRSFHETTQVHYSFVMFEFKRDMARRANLRPRLLDGRTR